MQPARHLLSPLLAGRYRFARGITVDANAVQLLSRFQFGLLFLISKFGFLCEALPCLPEKKKKVESSKKQQKRFWFGTLNYPEIFDLISVYSHHSGILSLSAAITGNGSAVPGDSSQVQVFNREDFNSSAIP